MIRDGEPDQYKNVHFTGGLWSRRPAYAPMMKAGDHDRIIKNLRSEDWQCHTRKEYGTNYMNITAY